MKTTAHLKLSTSELLTIQYARMVRDYHYDKVSVPIPNVSELKLIASMADLLELGEEKPQCTNCQFWKFNHSEADGRQTGKCDRYSRAEWCYDDIFFRTGNDSPGVFDFYTRGEFCCPSHVWSSER